MPDFTQTGRGQGARFPKGQPRDPAVCACADPQYRGGHHGTVGRGGARRCGYRLCFADRPVKSDQRPLSVVERPFKIGDLIEVDGSRGYVHSIEMLSTYIRAYDNRVIRFPNEMLAKSKLINLTRYPIRRIDLDIRVACRENPERVMTVLREVIIANPACFNDPEPVIALRGLDETSLDFLVGVWADNQEFFATRTSLLRDIKVRFDQEGIALPYGRVAVAQRADAVHRDL